MRRTAKDGDQTSKEDRIKSNGLKTYQRSRGSGERGGHHAPSERYGRSDPSRLTVKLRGRPTTCRRRGGPAISTGSRRAQPPAHHGPLQRLLERTPTTAAN